MAINPIIKQKAEDIRKKIFGSEVRESLASGIEAISEDVEATIGRQDYVEEQFQDVLDETTGKDVISAPELIAARNGKSNLKTRLDEEHAQVTAQLQKTEQSLNAQLAHIATNVKTFGAKGDGVTDDTQAIKNAINSGATKLLLPEGDFLISSEITVYDKGIREIEFRGKLIPSNDFTSLHLLQIIENDNITIKGFSYDNYFTGQLNDGSLMDLQKHNQKVQVPLLFMNCKNVEVVNAKIKSAIYRAIGLGNCSNVIIHQSYFTNVMYHVVAWSEVDGVKSSHNITFKDNYVDGVGGYVLDMDGNEHSITNNIIKNTTNLYKRSSGASSFINFMVTNNYVTVNAQDSNNTPGGQLFVNLHRGIIADNIIVFEQSPLFNNVSGVVGLIGSQVSITNNILQFRGNTDKIIRIVNNDNIAIQGNKIISSSIIEEFISVIEGLKESNITQNSITPHQTTAPKINTVLNSDLCENVVFSDNVIKGEKVGEGVIFNLEGITNRVFGNTFDLLNVSINNTDLLKITNKYGRGNIGNSDAIFVFPNLNSTQSGIVKEIKVGDLLNQRHVVKLEVHVTSNDRACGVVCYVTKSGDIDNVLIHNLLEYGDSDFLKKPNIKYNTTKKTIEIEQISATNNSGSVHYMIEFKALTRLSEQPRFI